MDKDMGADSRLSQAEPSSTVSALTGFDPARVWVIIRSTGEYSDRSEGVVGFVRSENEAQAVVSLASAEARRAVAAKSPAPSWDGTNEAEWEAHEAAVSRWLKVFRAGMTVDPGGVDEYEDSPYYYYVAASAIATETRRADTTGSVEDEGAAIVQEDL